MINELRIKLDKKEIGAKELKKEYLKKIKEKNPDFNCYITVNEDLSDAEAAQERIDKNASAPLTGIPVSVKDNIITKNMRTTCASAMLENFYPVFDAAAVEKIKAENAVILGKANMDEFGMGSSSENSYFGRVKNPYGERRSPGGSSGGSAVSVAAGLAAAAIGSDTGGSVRLPASYCGVCGLKPTYGTVSRFGLVAFSSSLDQIGTMGVSAADTGYLLNVIAGADSRDMTSKKRAKEDYLSLLGTGVSGKRIAVIKEFFDGAAEEVKENIYAALKIFEKGGAKVSGISMKGIKETVSAYYLISSAEAASNLSRFDGIKYGLSSEGESFLELIGKNREKGFGREVKRRIILGNYFLAEGREYYIKALEILKEIKAQYNGIFENFDFFITPTSQFTARNLDKKRSIFEGYMQDICTVGANLSGIPSISIPCGADKSGLPVGMSITGAAFSESLIIAAADFYEKSTAKTEVLM